MESLKKILRDLGEGVEVNKAIETNTAPMEQLEKDFAAFAKERAEKLAPGLGWKKPKAEDLKKGGEMALAEWIANNPTNYYALGQKAKMYLTEKQWQEAKEPLKKLIQLYPNQTDSGNAYAMLAEAQRALGETDQERETLSTLAALAADAGDAYLRLMELGAAKKDWPAVRTNATRFLAVNPLLPQPHRYMAQASESLSEPKQAMDSYRTLLLLDPADPAEVHFRLARLLHQAGDGTAKRHVLMALEEAPRFRDAHRLLLDIDKEKPRKADAVPLEKPETIK